MAAYIIKRLGIGALTLFALITITFFLTRLMPGNPFDADNSSKTVVDQLMREYRLDRPIGEQYAAYISNVFRGDLGVSFKKPGTSVNSIVARGFKATLSVGLLAFGISMALGVALGIWQATTRSGLVRGALLALSTLGVSIPNYVLALLLMMAFSVRLKLFPVIGLGTPAHYVLPVATMAAYPVAVISRLVKNTFGEAMSQEYVTLARAKGLGTAQIRLVHVLKNAILPVITTSGPMLAFLMTGSFVVESLFTVQGIGREFVSAVSNRDYTVIMGLSIFMGGLIILANLLSDVANGIVDPRVKLGK
ncbi:MAG: ABC transporter permease [Clostridiales bacterium]|nr:ABC transporter permease [Clostridiales bacterium]